MPISTWAGSPFYLTAERSFSNTESPSIRLDYTVTDHPMLIRVLKADKLDNLLDGQFNISRSYEQPVSELNPGYYFAKGLNKAQSPFKMLRGMLNVDFRKSLKDSNFSGAVKTVTDKPLVAVPQQVLVAPPKGYQVVNESYLDLQRNADTADDLDWWFGQDGWSEHRYKVRQVTLAPLPDGIYLLQAVQGKTEAQCLIQVSSLAVQVKQSSEQLLVRVMNRDLRPVADAKVSYRDGRGHWQSLPNTTDAAGELRFDNPEGLLDGKLLVRVDAPATTAGGASRTALTSTDFLPTQAKDDAVFVMTDRPIFKPGETFYYKGIVRSMQHGQLRIPAFESRQTDVSLIRADGNATGLQGQSMLSDFASFSGSFELDPSQTPGLYRLLAEIDHKAYGGEFRVRDYIKPSFYLEWLEHSPQVVAGQPFILKFRAKRYSGGVPQNVKFEVFLYRKKFEAPQFVVEAGAGLAAGRDYFGQIKTAAPLTQPQRLYSSIEERQAAELSNPWESAAKLDDEGNGSFVFTVPAGDKEKPDQEWIYTLMVRAQDAVGGNAILADSLYATLSEAQPAITFNKTVAAVADQDLQLLVQSSYADGKPAPRASGVVDVMLEQPGVTKRSLVKLDFATDDQGRQRLTLPALQAYGRLSAVARLESLDNRNIAHPADSLPATLIVAGSSGEAIADNPDLQLYTPNTILGPGETAKIFALLPKDWGNNESGQIWQTIAGARLFDSHGIEATGRSRWFEVSAKPEYGTGFYHTVTVPVSGGKYQEQTLGFRIVPSEKRLQIAIQPEKLETEPLKPAKIRLQVKRADGSPAADTELAVSVVDRAVYAVQGEFRPGIFDFFYPLQRSNLATFYSDDLQGYGYADLLRKPNFALSALKSQSKVAKKAMRDTAGWFPHVVTDANGMAEITVDMPANITEWLVTAVASDKDGRLGENTGQFRSKTDIAVDMVGPQFLRSGDQIDLAVKLTNHLPNSVKVAGSIVIAENLALQSGDLNPSSDLAGKAEQLWPLKVEANNTTGTATLKAGLTAPDSVRVGGMETFEIPVQAAAMPQVYAADVQDNVLSFELPAESEPKELTVRVNSGLLGASLQAAAMLVQYPYGCTEQLAHSTVPNLVLMDLIERAGLKPEQLGPLAQTLQRAKQNAALGLRKLIRNQKADGGFALWPGDSEASLPVTLIAMQALNYANALELEGIDVDKAYSKGVDWLATQADNNTSLDGFVLAGYSRVGHIYNAPWQQQAEFVVKVADDADAGPDDLTAALRLVLSYEQQKWHSFNQQFQDKPDLRGALIERLQQALDAIDPATYQTHQGALYSQLGFGFGLPSLIASGMGTLFDAQALPSALETKLKRQLLLMQKNGYWTSTYDTAQVIFNAREILSKEAEAARDQKPRTRNAMTANGVKLGALDAIPGGYLGRFRQFGDNGDLNEIFINELQADEITSATLAVEVAYRNVSARSSGLEVQRHFKRITAKGSELIDLSQSLHLGDVVVSEVRVQRNSDSRELGSEFVVIEDGIPSLAEGLENDQSYLADAGIQAKDDNYWASIKETQRYPDRIVRIAKLQAGAALTLYQAWRVNRSGVASIPPAAGFDMYDETIQGNSAASRVTSVK